MQTLEVLWAMAWKDYGWMPPALWLAMIATALGTGCIVARYDRQKATETDTPVSSR